METYRTCTNGRGQHSLVRQHQWSAAHQSGLLHYRIFIDALASAFFTLCFAWGNDRRGAETPHAGWVRPCLGLPQIQASDAHRAAEEGALDINEVDGAGHLSLPGEELRRNSSATVTARTTSGTADSPTAGLHVPNDLSEVGSTQPLHHCDAVEARNCNPLFQRFLTDRARTIVRAPRPPRNRTSHCRDTAAPMHHDPSR